MDKIVINVTGQADLDSTIKKLVELGVVDEKNAKSFQENSKENQKAINNQKSSYSGLKDAVNNYIQALPGAQQVQQIKNLTTGINLSTAATGGMARAMQVLKLAFIGLGIGAVVVAITALVSYFKKTESGSEGLERRLSQLGATVDVIIGRFARLGKGLLQLFRGEFTEAAETFKTSFDGVGKEIEEAANAAYDFTKALQDIEDAEKLMSVRVAETRNEIQKLLIQSRNRAISESERLKLLEQAEQKERAIIKEQFDLQQKKVDALKQENALKIASGELDKGNKTDELIAAEIKLADLKGNSLELLEKIANREAQLEEKRKADIEKRFQDSLKQLDDLEKLAVAKSKIEEKSQGDIIKIEEVFNKKKISLFKQYGKTKETDYKVLLLNQEALEKAYSNFLKEEQQLRIATAKKYNDDIIAEIDKSFKSQNIELKKQYAEQAQIIGDAYMQGRINRVEFEKQTSELTLQVQKVGIQKEIEVISLKLQYVQKGSLDEISLQEQKQKLQEDLYNKDLEAFKKAEDEKTAEEKKQAAQRKQIEQAAVDFAISNIQSIAAAFQESNRIKTENEIHSLQVRTDSDIEAIDRRNRAGLISDEQAAAQKEALQKKQKLKEAELKRKIAQEEKNFALFQIAINTASAIIKQLAATPLPAGAPLVALIAASGAVQAAIVASRPTPQFKKGGYTGDGNPNTEAGIVHKSEFVMPADKTAKYRDELQAMYEGKYNYREPIKLERSLTDVRQDNMADSIYKSMVLNGQFNDKNIVNAIGKNNNIKIKNSAELAGQIANKIADRNSEKGLYA